MSTSSYPVGHCSKSSAKPGALRLPMNGNGIGIGAWCSHSGGVEGRSSEPKPASSYAAIQSPEFYQ